MVEASRTSPSLWWRLSWQLSIVFMLVLAVVIAGLAVYGALLLTPNLALKGRLAVALDDSVSRDAEHKLIVREGPNLRALVQANDKIWFIAATPEGEIASFGVVPAAYSGMAPFIRFIRDADIRGARDTDAVASIDDFKTTLGGLRVLYGGNTSTSASVFTLLTALNPIYVPLLLLTLPAVFLTVARVIRRSLRGLKKVVDELPRIDPERAGSRLPLTDVPKEVVPLIVAFNDLLERLEAQFLSRQRFLIDAAHELRTPIAIMQTRIQGLPEIKERRRLLDDVARLGDMAEQLLDFERQGQTNDERQKVDIVDMARGAVAELAPVAIAAGYEIGFESPVNKLEIEGSPTSLPRAIANLVRNAIEHGGNRGVISVSVSPDARVIVADQGNGIPKDQQDLVFEPFYRITPRNFGAGLGLSLVRQIIRKHGGEVTVDSSSAGSAFTLHLGASAQGVHVGPGSLSHR